MTDRVDPVEEPVKKPKARTPESSDARAKRLDAETQVRRSEAAADEARVDRMIRENIHLRGA